MMRRLLVLLSLLVLAAVQPAHSAQLKLGLYERPEGADTEAGEGEA